MDSLIFLIVLISGISFINAQNYYVVAPKTLRLNSTETIAVAADGTIGGHVHVYVQDYPGKIKNISYCFVNVYSGQPRLCEIRLDPEKFPSGFLSSPGYPKLVSLTAHFPLYRKELLIPISNQSGYVFIQTDKPIYTPKERVSLRIIPLTENIKPSDEPFQLQIRNPNNSIVEQKLFKDKRKFDNAFVTHVYIFPKYPVLGEWSATVLYGHSLKQNTTVYFQLQEYVLPTFTLKLETPEVILPKDEVINIKLTAKYVYGKNVNGVVSFRLGVKKYPSMETIYFATYTSKKLVDGMYNLRLLTVNMKTHAKIRWFPNKSHLVVEAVVTDFATGKEEETLDTKCFFSDTPFFISFDRCLQSFKPGHFSVFEADITYANGQPAEGIFTKIKAVADNGSPVQIFNQTAKTGVDGRVSFRVRPQINHKVIYITLKTDDARYEFQAESSFKQHAFESTHDSYVFLSRNSPVRLQPKDKFEKTVYFEPEGLLDIYYVVTSRGRILKMDKLPDGEFKTYQNVQFEISYDMVPNFRLSIFAQHDGELLADSLQFEVESVCNTRAQVQIDPQYNIREPGHNGKIVLRGHRGTFVGILGVDEAVYSLSKKDLLTKEKVFRKFTSHDVGCGAGGGLTVTDVLKKAGITMGTNIYTQSPSYSCEEKSRRKRSTVTDIENMYTGFERLCCNLGLENDMHERTCEDRSTIVEKFLSEEEFQNCSTVFTECCKYAERNGIYFVRKDETLGKSFGNEMDEVDIDSELEDIFESRLIARSYFIETWLFQDAIIGPDGREEISAMLPHSITTWVIQAVSLSPHYGMCVSEPQKLVSFQKIFLQVNLPYSVVRNEQIEIPVTIFNYDERRTKAVVYMYGVEGLCSGTQPGEKSERIHVFVDGHSTATVSFPVIPLKAEVIPIRVVALSPYGSDIIVRELNVVPEGITKEINIPVTLDPNNLQRRERRRSEINPMVTDDIDPSQGLQVTAVRLCLPEDFIPGTETCHITAIGDPMGPIVSTAVNDPESILELPYGCGEQNIARLAPTLYAMRYLKVSGKMTAATEEKGYQYMRTGYANQITYRKHDGSYAVFPHTESNTWLTAFVVKVFCQAHELIHIDEDILCSGVKWLMEQQEHDGSYIENYPLYDKRLMGGLEGKVPLTAFVLIALEECRCNEEALFVSKRRSLGYLESNLVSVMEPLPLALVTYALTLSYSQLMTAANDRLLKLSNYDPVTNHMYWSTDNSAHNIQATSYALLVQLLRNNMQYSTSIVNWLNTKQIQSGGFESTQDTVIALKALSEYAIKAKLPSINLVTNISSSNDRHFNTMMAFNDQNAQVLQDAKVNRVGGTIFINTGGQGRGLLSVKLRYNVMDEPEDACKFDVSVNVTNTKYEELITSLRKELISGKPNVSPQSGGNKKLKYKLSVCVRHLGDEDAEMSIVDVGIFSGFTPVLEDLQKLVNRAYKEYPSETVPSSTPKMFLDEYDDDDDEEETDSFYTGRPPDAVIAEKEKRHFIDKFELTKKGVIFYLEKIPACDKFCFSFHVVREFVVGNTQMSYIKVYDYYNPGTSCTKFYKPVSNSPVIRTICDGGICQCAEGGCPPKIPFSELYKEYETETRTRREQLKIKFCDDFDYVWKGKLSLFGVNGGFYNISFTVTEIIKPGIERAEYLEGDTRMLLARDNCETAIFEHGITYLILGKDGQSYVKEDDQIWYRYLLDQTSVIHKWTIPEGSEITQVQRDFMYVTRQLKKNGCDL